MPLANVLEKSISSLNFLEESERSQLRRMVSVLSKDKKPSQRYARWSHALESLKEKKSPARFVFETTRKFANLSNFIIFVETGANRQNALAIVDRVSGSEIFLNLSPNEKTTILSNLESSVCFLALQLNLGEILERKGKSPELIRKVMNSKDVFSLRKISKTAGIEKELNLLLTTYSTSMLSGMPLLVVPPSHRQEVQDAVQEVMYSMGLSIKPTKKSKK